MIDVRSKSAESLTLEALKALIEHEIPAIRQVGLCDDDVVSAVAPKLFSHAERGSLGHASEFTRLGVVYSEVRSNPIREAYHEAAVRNIKRVRDLFRPYLSPIDEIRLALDELWPWGAHTLDVDGRKCFVGVTRYQEPGVDLGPHIDRLEWNLPDHIRSDLIAQLSLNIYLQVPEHGGELEIWNQVPSEDEYAALTAGRTYGVDREKLPVADHVLTPRPNEVIIINPRRLHAVRPAVGRTRITLSAFIGYSGSERPLLLWS